MSQDSYAMTNSLHPFIIHMDNVGNWFEAARGHFDKWLNPRSYEFEYTAYRSNGDAVLFYGDSDGKELKVVISLWTESEGLPNGSPLHDISKKILLRPNSDANGLPLV